MLTVKLPNGLELKGTPDVITKACEAMGFSYEDQFPKDQYYKSSSKGMLKISDMATEHLKNAVMIKLNEFQTEQRKLSTSCIDFVNRIMTHSELHDPKYANLVALIKELNNSERFQRDEQALAAKKKA